MTATSDDKNALLRGALIFLQDSQEQLKLDGRRNQELILRCQHLVIGITAALAEQSASPAPELPEPVAWVGLGSDEVDAPDFLLFQKPIGPSVPLYPESALTAERERADAAHAKFTAEFARAEANKRRAEQAEAQRDAAVALLREHGEYLNEWPTACVDDLNAKREEFLRGIE